MRANRTVAFHTLGCKLNFAESSTIARQFRESGFARVEMEEGADILVINTCSVTDQADAKCRNLVRRGLKANPEAFVVVIGCYAQLKPQEIAGIPGVDLVLGANEKFNVLDYIENAKLERTRLLGNEIKETKHFVPSFSSGDRTRTFLKVQDGCNYFCAFCTIPLARGRSRSANISTTLVEAKKAADEGAKEIVLTGVNIGDFGTAHGENFLGLIKELDKIEGIERFRISSIEPNLLSNEIISFIAESKKFVPHLHIPLQSGSDRILHNMRRRYLSGLYADRIARIKALMPDACIGADVITGFPGEDESAFLETYQFLVDQPISYLHVFSYSERDNTTALRIADVVPMEIRHERTKKLRILSEKKKRQFYESQQGQYKYVLFESDQSDGLISGFTDNYIKVQVPFRPELVNSIRKTKLDKFNIGGCFESSIEELTEI